jgi:hypothetical protein
MNTNQIYLEKRRKVLLPNSDRAKLRKGLGPNRILVATVGRNLENLGYAFTPKLFRALSQLTEDGIEMFYIGIVPILKKMKGAHVVYRPMYPNFPKQVIEASNMELYMNAMVHYWSAFFKDVGLAEETWLPEYPVNPRLPLSNEGSLELIDLGNLEDFNSIFTTLVECKSSISESDKQIIADFVLHHKDAIYGFLPETITSKEQLAFVAGQCLQHTTLTKNLTRYVKTPTDVLRIAAGFVGGDVSLAEPCKFKKFSRPQRRFLLMMLDGCKTNIAEEMVKWESRWLRLGEVLHPGEYANTFPRSAEAFKAIRNEKILTFNGKVEKSLRDGEIKEAVDLLVTRPGEFARRLDHILRMSRPDTRIQVITKQFMKVAEDVSTNVLLQLFAHFNTRSQVATRSVFPKGNLAKIHVVEEIPAGIDQRFCSAFANKIRGVLVERFSNLDKLGKVYVDPNLKGYLVPFSQRSAAKALKTIVRGSQIPLDGDYDTVRFFIWWKNMTDNGWDGRVDIDLSAQILDENFVGIATVAYYNLRDFAGHHSGDITNAPKGAAEFIDISLNKVLERGGRYIAMCINSFTTHKYCDLPECFAGWMGRSKPNSGEIFEAKTVKNKVDLASDTTIVIPLLIDAKERKVIWMDLALKQHPSFANNVRNNANNISLICKAMTDLRKPNLFDLLNMHAEGRGNVVSSPEKADVVFSEENIPFDIDTILTKYV